MTPFEPGAEAPGQPHPAVARAKAGNVTRRFRGGLKRRASAADSNDTTGAHDA